METYQDDTRELAERLAAQAKAAGRHEALNEVLRWAVEHREQLDRAGLTEPLITLCTR